MKVLLINPPKLNMIETNVPSLIDDESEIGYSPPIGLLYVAATAEKITGSEVKIIDDIVEKCSYEELEQRIREENPDVVGIQAMTFTLLDVMATAKVVKKINPETHVCIGGRTSAFTRKKK